MDPYLDDVYIYSDSLEDHVKDCKHAMDILWKEKLFLSDGKLEFLVDRIEVLGHVIEGDRIMMDPHKVDSVAAWKTPGIRIPMGILSAITGDAVPFRWGFTEARAFQDVKNLTFG